MHPIVALWSHPRSLSTVFERIMRERGDLTCFHEPFMYDYYVHRRARVMPHFDLDPSHPVAYPAIRDRLLAAAEAGPVFFKDMSYYVVPRLFDDEAFARRLTHSFLIRDPLQAILSYHKLDPAMSCEEIGLEAQWRLAQWLAAKLGQAPLVVEAEAVQADPQGTLGRYWAALGLDFAAQAFHWDAAHTPADWGQVASWHGQARASSGIAAPKPGAADRARAAFGAAAQARPQLRSYLDHHRPSYEALKAHAL